MQANYQFNMKTIELIDIKPEETEFTVVDVETTGLSARKNRIIEIGLVKINKLKITDTFQSFINPGTQVPSSISYLTGITQSDVENAPYFDEILSAIDEFIGDSVLVGHNLRFDHSFLIQEYFRCETEFRKLPTLCTLKLSQKILPDLPKKSLGNVRKHLRIRQKNTHRALSDATTTAKVLIKLIAKAKENFDIETTKELISFQSIPKTNKTFRIIKKKLAEDFNQLPEKPGVYFFKNSNGKIFYIGKAKSLKRRVNNYFSSSAPRKTKKIVRVSSRLGFETTNSELTALITEAELIKLHKPQFNTLLKKYSQNYFIKINKKTGFPVVEIANAFDFDGNDYFGPFSNRKTASAMLEIIDKTFQLRECNDKEFYKGKRCYLADIERCLAPCINAGVKEPYKDELQKVYEYLSGKNQFAVDRLLKKMKNLSAHRKYEEAAQVRDTIESILGQLNRSSILSEPINKAEILVEINDNGNKDYLLLIDGTVYIKDYFLNSGGEFEDALTDYFNDAIQFKNGIMEKDLEKIKIALSWFIKNKDKVKIHYLKEYNSKDILLKNLKFTI